MRYRYWNVWFAAAVCLVVAPHAWAGTMRCGNRLVVSGESMAAVRAGCGRPAAVQHSFKIMATTVRVGGRAASRSRTVGTEIPVETWTYNRGPRKLMMRIRFLDGKVVAIKTLREYGY